MRGIQNDLVYYVLGQLVTEKGTMLPIHLPEPSHNIYNHRPYWVPFLPSSLVSGGSHCPCGYRVVAGGAGLSDNGKILTWRWEG